MDTFTIVVVEVIEQCVLLREYQVKMQLILKEAFIYYIKLTVMIVEIKEKET